MPEVARPGARFWLCLLAFTASFGYACAYRIRPSIDARRYHVVAQNLVARGTFCETCDVPLANDTAIQGVGPGYQFFLAGVYAAFGVRTWIVWLLQALMHAAIVGWVFGIAVPKGEGRRVHLLPPLLYAVHPDVIQGNAMLMTEGLFTFLAVGFVAVFLRWWDEGEADAAWRRVAGYGAALGVLGALAAHVRPTGLPLFFAFAGLMLVGRRAWKTVLVATACFVLVHVPWAIRNERVLHRFIYNSAVGGADVWVGLHPASDGTFDLDKLADVRAATEGKSADDIERISMEEAREIIRERPVYAVVRTVRKFFGLFGLDKTSGFWFHYRGRLDQGLTVLASALANAVLLTLGFAGMLALGWNRRPWRDRPELLAAGLCILVLAIAPTLTVLANRYRIPMLPFFAVFAGTWLRAEKGRRESLAAAAGFVLACTGVNLSLGWEKVASRLGLLFPKR